MLTSTSPALLANTAPLAAGQTQLSGSDVLSIPVPDDAGPLVFRFTEEGIDLRLRWRQQGEQRQANAAGRRFGEQLLWLPVADRPDELQLLPVLPNAPPGQVSWQFEAAPTDVQSRAAQIQESAAAEYADQGTAEADQQALEAYQMARAAYRDLQDTRTAALTYRIGQLLTRLDRWEEATEAFRQALAEVAPTERIDRYQQALAFALYKLAEHAEALSWFDRAIAGAEQAGDLYDLALVTNNRCLVLHAQADMGAAASCFGRAEQAYAAAGLDGYRSVVLINQGAALMSLGRSEEASEALAKAQDWLVHLPAAEAERLHALVELHQAWAAMDVGRYSDALEHGLSGQARAQVSAQSKETWGQLIRVTAAALAALGQDQRAREQIESLLQSPELLTAVSDPARLAYAGARLEAEPQRRKARMAEVMTAAEAAGDDLTLLRAWLDVAEAALELGQPAEAERAAQGSLAMARQRQLPEIEIEALTLLAKASEPAQALDLQHRALQLAGDAGRLEDQFELLHARARQYQLLRQWDLSRADVVAAEQLYQQLREKLSSEELVGLRQRLQPLAAGSLAAGLLDPSLASERQAEWVWQRLLARRHWGLAPTTPGPAAEYSDLRQALLPPRNPTGSAAAERLKLEARRRAAERQDRRQSQELRPDWRELQQSLAPDEWLLVLVTDDPHSALLRIEATQVSVELLGPGSELEQRLTYLLRGLGRQDPLGEGALRARLSHLQGMLRLDRLPAPDSVRFLPGPGVEALPLELLLAHPPRRLLRLSAEELLTNEAATGLGSLADKGVLILEPQADTSIASGDWVPLPASRDEVSALLQRLPTSSSRRLSGSDAAQTLALGPAGQAPGLLHIAGHGLAHPQWSALDQLAFGVDPSARVALGQLRRQRWPVDLVVLSACRTAFGAEAELTLGFAQGFLQAGATQVLASSWSIDDLGTAVFMEHFYQALLVEGMDAATALASAQSRMREDPSWRAPYWWAGYQLWRPLLTRRTDTIAYSPP